MASPTVNVVRWTALISGVFYGLVHQGTLQVQYDAQKMHRQAEHRQHLIGEAKKAYIAKLAAEKAGSSAVVTDPEDPRFDLEKLVESWAQD